MAKTPQTVIKEIPHKFTDQEKIANQARIISILNEQDSVDAQRETYLAGHKATMKSLAERLKKARDIDRAGQEIRPYKCNVIRDRDTAKVNFVDVVTGNVMATEDFTTEDWAIVNEPIQGDLFEDEEEADAPPAEQELYRPSNDEPELKPNVDENGNVVAGEATDAYNEANPDSPYKHLSEHIPFEPVIPSYQMQPEQGGEQADEATDGTEPTADVAPTDLNPYNMGIVDRDEADATQAESQAAEGEASTDASAEGEGDADAGETPSGEPGPAPKPKPRPAKKRKDGPAKE